MKALFKKSLLFCLFGTSVEFCSSQQIQFAHTWFTTGDHAAGQFIEMPDSSFYLVGYSGPFYGQTNYYKAILLHVDKYGDTLWTRTYDSCGFSGIAPGFDGSLMVSGHMYTNTSIPHFSIAKMNLNGDTIWKKQYAYPYFTCASFAGYIHQCSDSGYVVFSNEGCDYGWFKIDSSGDTLWHNWNNMAEACYEIKPDPFGGYISVGSGGSGVSPYEVARLDNAGNEIWHRSYGNNIWGNVFNARDVVVTPDSNYLVGTDGWDWQLMKLDRTTGDTIWTRYTNQIYAMDDAGNGNVICVAGYQLELLNSNGDTIWQRIKPFAPNNGYFDVHKTLDGGYAFCGHVERNNPQRRLLCFVKLDSLGNTIFTSIYDPENNFEPLTFFPNPAQNELWISTAGFANEPKITFTLYDLHGREIMHELFDKSKPVDVSTIPNGVYIAIVKGKEKEVKGKVIIQK
jgi:type IX secretion system substrate protein